MPRWEPNARARLETAALDLYAARGYDDTTIADIADRAGVTSRTYFRYFPDKREALFGNAEEMREQITGSLRSAPADLPALSATLHALRTCEVLFQRGRHRDLRRRESVIDGSEELQERETRKLASIAAAVAGGLEERGADSQQARLVADLATVVFVHASRVWMGEPDTPFSVLVDRAAAKACEAFASQALGAAGD